MMDIQDIRIATQKSNQFILAFENLTSNTEVLDTSKSQLVLLESPTQICALIPKKSCANGHRIELYIIQANDLQKNQINDIRKAPKAIRLSCIVKDLEEYNEEQNHVVFKVLEDNIGQHKEIEAVILERQENFNNLIKEFRNTQIVEDE